MQLKDLKALTTLQRDECKGNAVRRVERNIGEQPVLADFQRHIGERPTREQFSLDLGRLWTALDVLAGVIFVPSLAVSSIHIIAYVGYLANVAYNTIEQTTSGTAFTRELYVAAHQWALIPLAEGSMILFLVMFGVSKDGWRRWVYLLLALLAVGFVLVSNLSSGLGVLISVLAPAFTIGIGLKLEHLILQYLRRDHDITRRYLEADTAWKTDVENSKNDYVQALAIWEAATADATQHPDYLPYLMNEIWAALMKPKGNQWAVEASPGFKRAAVMRELARENWTKDDVKPETEFVSVAGEEVKPSSVEVPFGNLAPGQGDHEYTPMTVSANGHGGAPIAAN